MKEKNELELKIDKDFLILMQPLSNTEIEVLSLTHENEDVVIATWKNYLIEEHEKYKFYLSKNIPYKKKCMDFQTKPHVISWICREQLKKDSLPTERYKYLIGKLYDTEKTINASCKEKSDISKEQKRNNSYIARQIGKEYRLSHSTVYKYFLYAQTLDMIKDKNEEIVKSILSGKLKISHENVIELSKFSKKQITHLYQTLSNNDSAYIGFAELRHELLWKRISEYGNSDDEIEIKKTPAFDPDSEINGLGYTIPSWISSISRIKKPNVSAASEPAKGKIVLRLLTLRDAIDTLLQIIKEDSYE